MQTLEELKAENAQLEAQEATDVVENAVTEDELAPQADELEAEETAGEVESIVDDVAAETTEETTDEPELEAWMQSDDDQTSQADNGFTGSDIAAAKKKLRTKLERRHSEEVEQLQAEINKLKEGGAQPQKLSKPKREDYYDHDDPDDAYADALIDWKMSSRQAEQQAEQGAAEAKRKQLEQQQSIATGVDQHLERVVKLAEASNITADAYRGAELNVRTMIESVFPNSGDAITDALIANVGEGSEKVFFNLGVNASRRAQLEKLLREDPSGIRAGVYLGKLSGELSAPTRRKTNTPKPAPQVNGDEKSGPSERGLKQAYDKAMRGGGAQAIYQARKKAKAAGVDISKW